MIIVLLCTINYELSLREAQAVAQH